MSDSTAQQASSQQVRASRQAGYETARSDVLAHVPQSARVILELGCSTGALGAAIKQRQTAIVVGVEPDPGYATDAAGRLDRVVAATAEEFLAERAAEAPFDCLICADVLEHLVDPWAILRQASDVLSPGATVVISLPNVLYWKALGRIVTTRSWPRDDAGIFDRTHLRWFSRRDAEQLTAQAKLVIDDIEPRFWAHGWRHEILRLLYRTPVSPFLAVQYIVSARRT